MTTLEELKQEIAKAREETLNLAREKDEQMQQLTVQLQAVQEELNQTKNELDQTKTDLQTVEDELNQTKTDLQIKINTAQTTANDGVTKANTAQAAANRANAKVQKINFDGKKTRVNSPLLIDIPSASEFDIIPLEVRVGTFINSENAGKSFYILTKDVGTGKPFDKVIKPG